MKVDGTNKHKFIYVIDIIRMDPFSLEELGGGVLIWKIRKVEVFLT